MVIGPRKECSSLTAMVAAAITRQMQLPRGLSGTQCGQLLRNGKPARPASQAQRGRHKEPSLGLLSGQLNRRRLLYGFLGSNFCCGLLRSSLTPRPRNLISKYRGIYKYCMSHRLPCIRGPPPHDLYITSPFHSSLTLSSHPLTFTSNAFIVFNLLNSLIDS